MNQDSLLPAIERIKDFCKQHGIALFYGELLDEKLGHCQWENDELTGLEGYLAVMHTLGVKILHLSLLENTIDQEELAQIKEELKESAQEKRAVYEPYAELLSNRTREPIQLSLSFIFGGIDYQYTLESALFHPHAALSSFFLDDDDPTKEELDEELQEAGHPFYNSRRVSEDVIQETARKIITEPKYMHARHQKERSKVAKQLAQSNGIALEYDRTRVADEAEDLFKEEVEALRDQDRKEKVQALRKERPKISKRDASNLLNIPERDLNKYWDE
ncbi:MAG: hypothetical protein EOO06_19690 [Chitinophagaceae bacterium]|nr:MAG: hypothetical protein EOO06_19690 [Chitinophagaceae bacterium]